MDVRHRDWSRGEVKSGSCFGGIGSKYGTCPSQTYTQRKLADNGSEVPKETSDDREEKEKFAIDVEALKAVVIDYAIRLVIVIEIQQWFGLAVS